MFLIPLDETIEFNQTAVTGAYFAGIYIAAFAYHPVYEQFLYLLYTIVGRTGEHNLMIWNSYTKTFLQNVTLVEEFNCNGRCTLKVTENLLLIQSPTIISIYRISQFKALTTSPILYTKQAGSASDDASKQADIYKQKYVFFKSNQTIFGLVTATSHTTYLYDFNITNSPSLQIGFNSQVLYVVYDASQISVLFFKCVACIYDGRLTYPPVNISSYVNKLDFQQAVMSSIKVYLGDQKVTYQNRLGYMFWVIVDGIQIQYFTNTYYAQKVYERGTFPVGSSSNGKYLFVYNQTNNFFNIKSFQPDNISSQVTDYDFGRIIKRAAISSSLETFAIYDEIDTYKLTQYQMVESCQPYNAQVSILNVLFCDCTLYNELNRCALKSEPSSTTQFPIYGVIGIVASVVLIVLGAYFLKTNYKKCLKSSKRTPWKYNPVELMSFEV